MTTRFVAPDGSTMNKGTENSPWSLAEILDDNRRLFAQPGDTVRLLPGTYRFPTRDFNYGYRISCIGEPDAPITFDGAYEALIDGGLHTHESRIPKHIRIRGLECFTSENVGDARRVDAEGSDTYSLLKRPSGNINLVVGHNIRVINCTIRDASSGIGFWGTVGGDSLLYGNIIFNNGWKANDRRHGHGIYTQNKAEGWKHIYRNVFTQSWQNTLQIYNSDAGTPCDRFYLLENVSYNSGTWIIQPLKRAFDLRVNGNVAFNGGIAIANYTNVEALDNFGIDIRKLPTTGGVDGALNLRNNITWQTGWSQPRIDGKSVPVPGVRAWIFANAFDDSRATVTIHRYKNEPSCPLTFGDWAKPGDVLRFFDPTNMCGEPVHTFEADQLRALPLSNNVETYIVTKNFEPCYSVHQELTASRQKIASLESINAELTKTIDETAVKLAEISGNVDLLVRERDGLRADVSRLEEAARRDMHSIRIITEQWNQ